MLSLIFDKCGCQGLSEDERLHLASAMVPTGPAQRPESLSVREQATQAGPGFVTGGKMWMALGARMKSWFAKDLQVVEAY